jgi:hypothetical protein
MKDVDADSKCVMDDVADCSQTANGYLCDLIWRSNPGRIELAQNVNLRQQQKF